VADESLSEVFWGVARQLRRQSTQTVAPWDITPGQARALGVLTHGTAIRLSDLADRLRIAARSTTEVVDGLEERGLVERQADPTDRRATLIALTEEGNKVAEAIRLARIAEAEAFFGTLSAADRAHLARTLAKLRDA
jgi:DNA-binding MarR family transcriptional regulator